ncbi:hypothetical protein C8F04DRAFT_1056442 [Mycena alexandri]|uniref:Uncharacterized protein n=1 Tax=Mycena alexandri TaxID=1745969 RepID=A0AAD6WL32_9AGAR|nr:hypothetical protein C8F04DRAFT_1056442 [Mycena alexandri]
MLFGAVILLATALIATASPLRPQELVVISPNITYPTEAVSWPAGSTQTVTWDITRIPPEAVNNKAMLLLGHYTTTWDADGNEVKSENLDIKHPLATGFNITTGSKVITVPDTTPGKNYIIVLFGDSGNVSSRNSRL